MNCKNFHLYGSAYIDNEVSCEEKLEFENHINNCECCNIKFQNLKIVIESINELEEVDLPINFSSELRIKLENEKSKKIKKFNKNKMFSNIAASILIFVASFSLINTNLINSNKMEQYNAIEDKHVSEKNITFKMAPEEVHEESSEQSKEIENEKSVDSKRMTPKSMAANEKLPQENTKENTKEDTENSIAPSNYDANSLENVDNQRTNNISLKNLLAGAAIVLGLVILIYNFSKK